MMVSGKFHRGKGCEGRNPVRGGPNCQHETGCRADGCPRCPEAGLPCDFAPTNIGPDRCSQCGTPRPQEGRPQDCDMGDACLGPDCPKAYTHPQIREGRLHDSDGVRDA